MKELFFLLRNFISPTRKYQNLSGRRNTDATIINYAQLLEDTKLSIIKTKNSNCAIIIIKINALLSVTGAKTLIPRAKCEAQVRAGLSIECLCMPLTQKPLLSPSSSQLPVLCFAICTKATLRVCASQCSAICRTSIHQHCESTSHNMPVSARCYRSAQHSLVGHREGHLMVMRTKGDGVPRAGGQAMKSLTESVSSSVKV